MKPKYAVITPARDEDKYIARNIASVIAQSIPPSIYILVDDGSKDRTLKIMRSFEKHTYIRILSRQDRGKRSMGSGVMQAFNAGLSQINLDSYDFVVKLDADIVLPKDYFEKLFDEFDKDPKLGIASGKSRVREKKAYRDTRLNDDHAGGASKIYDVDCFKDIGGLVPTLGWDTLDEISAQMLGWKVRSFGSVRFTNLRPMAASTGPWVIGKIREGKISFMLGYHPIYLVMRAIRQLWERPKIIGSFGLIIGFTAGYIWRYPRVLRVAQMRYLRKLQSDKIKNFFFFRTKK